MKIIKLDKCFDPKGHRGVALGNFDGVHLGHQQLLKALIEKSREMNLCPVVYTFSNHPRQLEGKSRLKEITGINKKTELFQEAGVKELILSPFDETMKTMEPEDFVRRIILGELGCRLVVVGFDYRFGRKAKGDVDLLQKLGKEWGFEVIVIPPFKLDGEKVSSSLIRRVIEIGEVHELPRYLGRHYSIMGPVIYGKGLGGSIGYPTANIKIQKHLILPAKGVYVTLSKVEGACHKSITSVGHMPKFNKQSAQVESFLFNYEGDLYHRSIETFFIQKLRDQLTFENPGELREQIKKDIDQAKSHLQSIKGMVHC